MARTAEIKRSTKETEIELRLNLDGTGTAKFTYPIGFMKHILDAFTHHGLFDLELSASGDLDVDQHHLIEDTGMCLGMAFAKALHDKTGIQRVGSCLYPMDETLVRAAVDLCGRPFLVYEGALSGIPLVSATQNGGCASFQTDLVADFWLAFVNSAACALHLDVLRGRNDHHKIEAMFKAAGRALRQAVEYDRRADKRIPSTKGTLDSGGIYLC